MRKGLLVVLLGCVLAWASGCRIVVVRHEPRVRVFRAERMEPEGWYETVFRAMEKCTGKSKSYDALEWYLVGPNKLGNMNRNGVTVPIAGLLSPGERIYLDERYVMDAGLIAHELLHYLTEEGDTPLFDDILEACGIS